MAPFSVPTLLPVCIRGPFGPVSHSANGVRKGRSRRQGCSCSKSPAQEQRRCGKSTEERYPSDHYFLLTVASALHSSVRIIAVLLFTAKRENKAWHTTPPKVTIPDFILKIFYAQGRHVVAKRKVGVQSPKISCRIGILPRRCLSTLPGSCFWNRQR